MIYGIIIILILANVGTVVFLTVQHKKTTDDLQLRLASKSLEEYHYFRDVQPLEVEHNKEVLKNVRDEKKTLTAEDIEKKKAAEEF
jgi:hypothetical protein